MAIIIQMLIAIISTFTIKGTKLYIPVVTLSARDSHKLSNFLSKGFERLVFFHECKTNVKIKIRQMNIDIFSNQKLLELIDCLLYFIQKKRSIPKGSHFENTIYQKTFL